MSKKTAVPVEVFITRVPPAVKKRFKARCAAAGRSMQSVLVEFMRDFAAVNAPKR